MISKFKIYTFILSLICCLNIFGAPSPTIIRVALSENSPPTSFVEDGKAVGILKELLELVFEQMPNYKLEFYTAPWNRAQYQLQNNNLDMFVTYPSQARKEYANFMEEPLYNWDFSFLIYNKDNPKSKIIQEAKSFEDLRNLTFLSQEGIDWEKESIPPYIKRIYYNKIDGMFHSMFKRTNGDFMIMSDKQATYLATKFGYEQKLGIQRVSIFPNSNIFFHIGIRKNFSRNREILLEISEVLKSLEYQKKRKNLLHL